MFHNIRVLGSEIRAAVEAPPGSLYAAKRSTKGGGRERWILIIRVLMKVVVTLVGLFVGSYVLMSDSYSEELKRAAAGWIGLLLGCWVG